MRSLPFRPFAPSDGARSRSRQSRTGAPPDRARRARRAASLLAALGAAFILAACGGSGDDEGTTEAAPAAGAGRFDEDRAFSLIEEQVAIGPRPAGSEASRELAERLRAELPNGGFEEVPGGLRNVVGSLPGPGPAVVIGAHYDTEVDPPDFVGANDGAAGTAAVVELSRILASELPEGHREVRFVLFDGEEEPAGCPDSEFQECALRGSKAYVAANGPEVRELILLDYIANDGLSLPREANSDPELWERLRAAADRVGAGEYFPPGEQGVGAIDDHVPFLLAGIPAIDLIDFSYEYADTSEDTPDKLDPAALGAVGEAVTELVIELAAPPPSG
jgi:glutaminyl-peptide cyclotransferase